MAGAYGWTKQGNILKRIYWESTMNSTLSECKRALGRMISEQTLVWKGIRRQYENDKYVSTIVTNEFGVIIEMDCQLKNLPEQREEFILKKYFVPFFAGDYTGGIKITIPSKCNRISSHAFDAGEYGYSLNAKRKYTRNITIPKKVFVEEDAFANCGSLTINIAEERQKLRKKHLLIWFQKSPWKIKLSG